MYKKSPVSTRQ